MFNTRGNGSSGKVARLDRTVLPDTKLLSVHTSTSGAGLANPALQRTDNGPLDPGDGAAARCFRPVKRLAGKGQPAQPVQSAKLTPPQTVGGSLGCYSRNGRNTSLTGDVSSAGSEDDGRTSILNSSSITRLTASSTSAVNTAPSGLNSCVGPIALALSLLSLSDDNKRAHWGNLNLPPWLVSSPVSLIIGTPCLPGAPKSLNVSAGSQGPDLSRTTEARTSPATTCASPPPPWWTTILV